MDHATEHHLVDTVDGFDRVILVHGFGAEPRDHWFPWLARSVHNVEIPRLPCLESPEASTWATILAERIEASLNGPTGLTGLVIVTHSLGGLTALRAIEQVVAHSSPVGGRAPHLAAFVSVAPFAQQLPPTGDADLDHFLARGLSGFLDDARPCELRPFLGHTTVIHSDDDPLVPQAASQEFAAEIDADVVTVPGAGHFLASDGVTSLPQVVRALNRMDADGIGTLGE
ncbi:serine hydrolase family protein [Actinomyces viscosus]|uniref:RBBP9/YdeN family alpha/beta hydrolase n=1 Tax=Actinomyces viscosus TaxID=1656 RepID=UPI000F846039|nr:alpha/beta fold hydrolase [Actinomyces viscosus]TFH51551.1 serine hydrolase family protein [Actinomyces viscosus]